MAARTWKLFTVICLISVYFLTFVGLHYRFVYSFYLSSALLHVCGCLLFELWMMKVFIPYDRGHKEVYNAYIMRTETEPKIAVFLAKPTKTDRQQNFWNRNNTNRVILHTVMDHSWTSTYTPNFIEIEETLWTDIWDPLCQESTSKTY